MLNFLNRFFGYIFIFLIKIYQFTLSPDKGIPSLRLKGKICSHTPHCSQYSINALKRYGFIPGFIYAMERVSTCLPSENKIYDPEFYKILFFSSDPIGVEFLKYFDDNKRFEIVGVVSAPDKPIGRGRQIQENIIKSQAKELNINNIFTPVKINPEKSDEGKKFYEQIKALEPDFIVVIAYGKIIPKTILDIPKIGPINFHTSILPRYRGCSPIQSALLNCECKTGATIMLMDEKMDEGDILKIFEFKVDFDMVSKNVTDVMTQKGPKILGDSLRDFAKGHLKRIPQNHLDAIYCQKICKDEGIIDIFEENLSNVWNKYKAFYGRPKIWFICNEKFKNEGERVIIEELSIDKDLFEESKSSPLFDQNLNLNRAVKTMKVKPQGKGVMDIKSFLNGYKK